MLPPSLVLHLYTYSLYTNPNKNAMKNLLLSKVYTFLIFMIRTHFLHIHHTNISQLFSKIKFKQSQRKEELYAIS